MFDLSYCTTLVLVNEIWYIIEQVNYKLNYIFFSIWSLYPVTFLQDNQMQCRAALIGSSHMEYITDRWSSSFGQLDARPWLSVIADQMQHFRSHPSAQHRQHQSVPRYSTHNQYSTHMFWFHINLMHIILIKITVYDITTTQHECVFLRSTHRVAESLNQSEMIVNYRPIALHIARYARRYANCANAATHFIPLRVRRVDWPLSGSGANVVACTPSLAHANEPNRTKHMQVVALCAKCTHTHDRCHRRRRCPPE